MSDVTAEHQPNAASTDSQENEDPGRGERAAELRAALVERLLERGTIVSPAVKAAIATVPREKFMPADTSLDVAYAVDNSVVTKYSDQGAPLSSVSAAFIQARMLEQANLTAGASVLEIGSGGLNAAYIAEIVGEKGRIVSVDIDAEVTERAVAYLAAAGYGTRVEILVADADAGVPGDEEFDAIIVTVGVGDVAPAWLRQLKPSGTIVLPLVMNGITRTIGFRRDGDHLTSTSTEVAGFVPMQGAGAFEERLVTLTGPSGHPVTLFFQADAPADGQVDDALARDTVIVWSGVEFPHGLSFADLHLWFAWNLPGFCRLKTERGSELDDYEQRFPYGVVRGAGFAYMVVRPLPENKGSEFGARGFGPDAALAAEALVEQMRAWDREARPAGEPEFGYWPIGTTPPSDAVTMPKRHGVVTISRRFRD